MSCERRNGLKNYRRFLSDTLEEMKEAVREGENVGWHHLPEYEFEARHYMRLLTWLDDMAERLRYYDNAKTGIPKA